MSVSHKMFDQVTLFWTVSLGWKWQVRCSFNNLGILGESSKKAMTKNPAESYLHLKFQFTNLPPKDKQALQAARRPFPMQLHQ